MTRFSADELGAFGDFMQCMNCELLWGRNGFPSVINGLFRPGLSGGNGAFSGIYLQSGSQLIYDGNSFERGLSFFAESHRAPPLPHGNEKHAAPAGDRYDK